MNVLRSITLTDILENNYICMVYVPKRVNKDICNFIDCNIATNKSKHIIVSPKNTTYRQLIYSKAEFIQLINDGYIIVKMP